MINPLSLAFKTFKQLKTSPSYKQPLVYTFGDDGIGVSQGEEHMDLEWKGVYRLLMTKYMLGGLYKPDACICDSARSVGRR